MKPRSYYCASVETGAGCGKEVPLDHWTSMACPRPPMPLGWIIAICQNRIKDKDHADGKITATRLFDCPRKVLIEDFVEPIEGEPNVGLVFDPRRMNSAHFGTVVHREIELHTPGGGYKEIRFPLEGQEIPTLDFGGGVTCGIGGGVDYIEPDVVCLEDYKKALC